MSWTGIGSLPFHDRRAAVDHVIEAYPRMPFVPQFAGDRWRGGMLRAILPDALPLVADSGFGVKLAVLGGQDGVARTLDETPVGSVPLLVDLEETLAVLPECPDGAVLKGQLPGPVSILRGVRDAASAPLIAYPELVSVVVEFVRHAAREMALRLLEGHDSVTVWLDEPMLGLPGVDEEAAARWLAPILETLHDLEVATGLHCCSEPPFALLGRLALDYVSFDALQYAGTTLAHAATLTSMVERGTRLALGLTRPLADVDSDPTPFVRALAAALDMRGPLADVVVLTPTCGTLLAPVERERTIAQNLRRWAEHLESGPENAG